MALNSKSQRQRESGKEKLDNESNLSAHIQWFLMGVIIDDERIQIEAKTDSHLFSEHKYIYI